MTRPLLFSVLTTLALLIGCGEKPHTEAAADGHEHAAGTRYTCPMHPSVVEDHPGSCPICKMDLVPVRAAVDTVRTDTATAAMQMNGQPMTEPMQRVSLSAIGRIRANVATVEVTRQALEASGATSVAGRIGYAEDRARTLSAPLAGRVDGLAVDYVGQPVASGAALVDLYAPDLLTTQSEHLLARRSRSALPADASPETVAQADDLVHASAERLRLLGLTTGQLAALVRRGSAGPTTALVAPFAGAITWRGVERGQYVAAGAPLVQIVPLDPVWLVADVVEGAGAELRRGGELTAVVSGGLTVRGKIDFISPTVDPATRTIQVRATLPNPTGRLRPGALAEVTLAPANAAGQPLPLVVPTSAVIETGRRTIVWVEVAPNQFEGRTVTLGRRGAGAVEVASGLAEGERVVASGAFLIDSDATLRSAAGGPMGGMAM